MSILIRASALRRSQTLNRMVTPGAHPEQMSSWNQPGRRPNEVMWPRYIRDPLTGLRTTRLAPIPVAAIPPGWTGIQAHVPMRLADCQETDCPMFLRGWTEVLPGDGNRIPQGGRVSRDEAVKLWGQHASVLPHPPGTPCPRLHKMPSGIPPLYTVDGRVVLWHEFEDAVGGGVHRQQQIIREGRY